MTKEIIKWHFKLTNNNQQLGMQFARTFFRFTLGGKNEKNNIVKKSKKKRKPMYSSLRNAMVSIPTLYIHRPKK